jgi:hypothetical protein
MAITAIIIMILQLKEELAELLEQDAKADKLRR